MSCRVAIYSFLYSPYIILMIDRTNKRSWYQHWNVIFLVTMQNYQENIYIILCLFSVMRISCKLASPCTKFLITTDRTAVNFYFISSKRKNVLKSIRHNSYPEREFRKKTHELIFQTQSFKIACKSSTPCTPQSINHC